MTTVNPINQSTIIHFLLRSRSYQSIRAKYKINYNCITFLLSCYVYSLYVDEYFNSTRIYKFVHYYQYHLVKRYLDQLISCNLINLSGRKYSLTDLGLSAIEEISNNNDNVLYSFCSKYNIEL